MSNEKDFQGDALQSQGPRDPALPRPNAQPPAAGQMPAPPIAPARIRTPIGEHHFKECWRSACIHPDAVFETRRLGRLEVFSVRVGRINIQISSNPYDTSMLIRRFVMNINEYKIGQLSPGLAFWCVEFWKELGVMNDHHSFEDVMKYLKPAKP